MMKIITSFEALDIDSEIVAAMQSGTADMDQVRYIVWESLKALFEDYSDDSGTYIASVDLADNFVFGALEPQKMVEAAKSWNLDIKKQFLAALGKLGTVDPAAPEQLPLDNSETYDMHKAARELDDNWWCYAEHGVYLPNNYGYPYFTVILKDAQAADMAAHPEDYVIYNAYIKD